MSLHVFHHREAAFDRLYTEHAESLLGFLVYRTGDRTLAEDILADTFERVLTAGRGFHRGPDNEKAWLYTIALNRLRDLARRRGAEERALERVLVSVPDHEGGGPLLLLEDRDELDRALAGLPDDEREALSLRYGADLSLREIARVLDAKQTTVDGRVYRGLRRLREQLAA
jgi:RNA polymerase sigma-70 factor (ECF subfamily)